jgi:hypothetical protein
MNKIFSKFRLLITIGLLSILFPTDYTFAQNPGNSLDFDGSNDYISIPDATALDITNQIAIELTTVVSNVAPGWSINRKSVVFYNGSNFFLLYTAGGGDIWYKSSTDNVTWSGASSLVPDQSTTELAFDIYLVNDAKFDLVYSRDGAGPENVARTCTIAGGTITAGDDNYFDSQVVDIITVVRTGPSSDRVYILLSRGNGEDYINANETGDITASTTWSKNSSGTDSGIRMTMVPYQNTDQVLVILTRDRGGGEQ